MKLDYLYRHLVADESIPLVIFSIVVMLLNATLIIILIMNFILMSMTLAGFFSIIRMGIIIAILNYVLYKIK